MEFAINESGTFALSALLETLGAATDGLRAVWVPYPTAAFVQAADLSGEVEVAGGTTLRTFGEKDCMAGGLLDAVRDLRLANECTCTFGHEGAYQAVTILGDICSKKGKPGDIALLRDLAQVMTSQAICDEGKAIGRAISFVLDNYGPEVEAHITRKVCGAGSCQAYRTYHILVSRCTGCGKCLKACKDDAILGKPKFVHVINQKMCVQCNKCLEACPEHAVVTAGAEKPKTPPKPIPCKRK